MGPLTTTFIPKELKGNDSNSQESALGYLLFILFINDLNLSVTSSNVQDFADDTNLILINQSLKKINSLINHGPEQLRDAYILATQKLLSLKKHKTSVKHLNFRISEEKINLSSTVKYLGVILQKHLESQRHINSLLPKLNRKASLLSKIQHYATKFLFRKIYYFTFNSCLIYTCQTWSQNENTIPNPSEIQDETICLISFKDKNDPINELYFDDRTINISEEYTAE